LRSRPDGLGGEVLVARDGPAQLQFAPVSAASASASHPVPPYAAQVSLDSRSWPGSWPRATA